MFVSEAGLFLIVLACISFGAMIGMIVVGFCKITVEQVNPENTFAVIIPSSDGGYVGKIPSLRGCITQGATIPETLDHLADAYRCWVEVADEYGLEVPELGR